jgi:hypothetical protein
MQQILFLVNILGELKRFRFEVHHGIDTFPQIKIVNVLINIKVLPMIFNN